MGRIRILPEAVVTKIAAGEVVERPASVAKELVENAIDARASEIAVEIRGGGKSLVRVSDNGIGMGRDDALLAVERHSTSKISGAADLFSVGTLGFRGEALPSIAAVSRMTILTKEKGALSGTQVSVEGGRVGEARDAGAPDGTEVVVRDLFFNTPARRKFLRSERAEASQIAAIVTCEALARPEVGFTLISDGREIFKVPASELLRRIADLFGADVSDSLVCFDGGREGIRVGGYISGPNVTRGNRTGQYFFVNGRFVHDRVLNGAVSDTCRGILPSGRYPFLFLFLEIEPARVDVNVHPAKREVRFREGALVREAVMRTVSDALRSSSLPLHRAAVSEMPAAYETVKRGELWERVPAAEELQAPLPIARREDEIGGLKGIRPLGQVRNLYVVCEDEDGVLIIDQHAAHERILFERMMRLWKSGAREVQRLLIPAVVTLSPAEAAILGEYTGALNSLGVGVEAFGKNEVKIDHLPSCLGDVDPERLARDIISELAEEGRSGAAEEEMAARVAKKVCRAAVKRRDPLKGAELARLVEDLMRCESPNTCPHGRPTIVRISMAELNKKFDRS